MPTEPLRSHRLFHTQDIDRARQIVAQKFCSHDLVPGASYRAFDTCHNHAAGENISLNYLRYGSEVAINPGELTHFYLVQLPLRGSAQVTNGNCKVESRSRTATVLNPTQETRMIWHKGCEKILVQINRRALHDLAESLTGHHLNQSLVFDPEIDMNRPAMQKWCRSVQSALELAEAGQGFGGVQHAQQARIEETLVLGFLNNQRSSISHLLGSKHPAPSSQQLRKAQSYMLANLAEPITLQQVARQSGCSLRSLQCGFKAHFGCSPKQFLQRQRLGYAHHLLQAANPDQLVSSLAYDAGFTHLGRFSIAYRMAYGESPSDTLAKTKRTH